MNSTLEFDFELIKKILLEAHKTQSKPIERRLYYDEKGHVITYTCEDLPGNFIIVTPEQFAEARPDVIVRDGKIIYTHKISHVSKLVRSTTGTATSSWDINILIEPDAVQKIFWSMQDHPVM